jgi:DNA-binding NarL/FixJ family response regulator
LIIERDHDLRAAMCCWLRAIGFEAVGENTGQAGLSHLALREQTTKPIDGVLMNVNAGVKGSREVLRELQKTHPQLPVVVMGESRRSEAISEALELGASGYLLPPFDPDAFKSKCLVFFRNPNQPNSY